MDGSWSCCSLLAAAGSQLCPGCTQELMGLSLELTPELRGAARALCDPEPHMVGASRYPGIAHLVLVAEWDGEDGAAVHLPHEELRHPMGRGAWLGSAQGQ